MISGFLTFLGVTTWPCPGKGTTTGRHTRTDLIPRTHLREKVPEEGFQEVAPLLSRHSCPHQLLLPQLPLLEAQPTLLQSRPEVFHECLPLFLQVKQQHLQRQRKGEQPFVKASWVQELYMNFVGGSLERDPLQKSYCYFLGSVGLSGFLVSAEVALKVTYMYKPILSSLFHTGQVEGRAIIELKGP